MKTGGVSYYQYAFLDSGSGGLPYLAQLKTDAPNASCVYLADTAHFPYGEKTRDEVVRYAIDSVGILLNHFRPEVIIIACNTISVAALDVLRERYSLPFVGTVPAIKLGAAASLNRKIGLLATSRTVNDPYTDQLIAQFAADCKVVKIGDSTLVSRIETELVSASHEERLQAVRPSIEQFKTAGVDTIILACTHFLHVIDEIHEMAGPDIRIIDSRDGVIHQALRLVPPRNFHHGEKVCYITGSVSDEAEARYTTLTEKFGITWGGVI